MRLSTMMRLRVAVTAAALFTSVACGGTDVAQPATTPPSPSPSLSSPPAEGELVTSQDVLPAEAAYGFADIATSTPDSARAWERFRLDGVPPEIDDGTALLFRGLGESSSCPAEFAGIEVGSDQVRMASPPPASGAGSVIERVCTSDYRPRTLVVAVPVGALPQGPFRFEGFVLSTTPLPSPPAGPSVVESWIAGDPELQVSAEPSVVEAGGRVDVRLTTDRYIAWPGSWTTLLDRWDGQRWLPAPGSDPTQDHPAAAPATSPVPVGTTGPLAVVDTTGLPPGDYRISARVGLGDAEGSSGVQGFFRVTA
jgi:hypothetical protein